MNMSLEEALKECIRVPIKDFALIVVLESGEECTYASHSLQRCQTNVFSPNFRDEFRRSIRAAVTKMEIGTSPLACSSVANHPSYSQDEIYDEFDICHGKDFDQRFSWRVPSNPSHRTFFSPKFQLHDDDKREMSTNGKRKLVQQPIYSTQYVEDKESEACSPTSIPQNHQLMIADEVEVQHFYRTRFLDMQQSACRIVGKAFVKSLEPRKQSQYPYIKGNEAAPPWWPPTKGYNRVRHKEPDHLLKPERIRLLVWILRMFIDPNDQQLAMTQRLGLDIGQLEEVTMEALSTWFHDKQHPENVTKESYLKEIFKVAKA